MDNAGERARSRLDAIREGGESTRPMSRLEKTATILIALIAVVLAISEINGHDAMKTTLAAELTLANQEAALASLEGDRAMLENSAVLLTAVSGKGGSAGSNLSEDQLTRARAARINSQVARTKGAIAVTEEKVAHSNDVYDNLEVSVGFLQVAIVLVSLSIVIGAIWLLGIGAVAGAAGLLLLIYALYVI